MGQLAPFQGLAAGGCSSKLARGAVGRHEPLSMRAFPQDGSMFDTADGDPTERVREKARENHQDRNHMFGNLVLGVMLSPLAHSVG